MNNIKNATQSLVDDLRNSPVDFISVRDFGFGELSIEIDRVIKSRPDSKEFIEKLREELVNSADLIESRINEIDMATCSLDQLKEVNELIGKFHWISHIGSLYEEF